ncbi:MAG: hypothetical protein ACJAWW_001615 [Sulfurimonas sp.]|jgi:hypothetical protein
MWITILKILLPIAIKVLNKYVSSSDSQLDNKILDVAKTTSKYMSKKDNNTLSLDTASAVALAIIKKVSN